MLTKKLICTLALGRAAMARHPQTVPANPRTQLVPGPAGSTVRSSWALEERAPLPGAPTGVKVTSIVQVPPNRGMVHPSFVIA